MTKEWKKQLLFSTIWKRNIVAAGTTTMAEDHVPSFVDGKITHCGQNYSTFSSSDNCSSYSVDTLIKWLVISNSVPNTSLESQFAVVVIHLFWMFPLVEVYLADDSVVYMKSQNNAQNFKWNETTFIPLRTQLELTSISFFSTDWFRFYS